MVRTPWVIGLKSTYGRIPFLPHGSAWSCLHNGFLANTVRDQAIGYMSITNMNKIMFLIKMVILL